MIRTPVIRTPVTAVLLGLAAAALTGCPPAFDTWPDLDPNAPVGPLVDADGDGYTSDVDCDDTAATAYPGAPDIACDGLDNDCDPTTIEPGGVTIGATPYDTLNAALTAATSGDTVTLCEGRYDVPGTTITTAITLAGAGAGSTALIGDDTGPLLTITGADVTLSGLALTNGRGAGSTPQGGGLWIGGGANVTVDGCDIHDNRAADGGGVYVDSSATLSLLSSTVRDNWADNSLTIVSHAGGVDIAADATLTLENSTVSNNLADGACGGLRIGARATVTGTGTADVVNNTAGLPGGGVCAHDAAVIDGLAIHTNHSDNVGGGLSIEDLQGTLTVQNTSIEGNDSSLSGGGITGQGVLTFTNVTVRNNEAAIGGGGFMLTFADTVLTLTDSVVTANIADPSLSDGGGVELTDATLVSINTTWGSNTPHDVGLETEAGLFNATAGQDFSCTDGAGCSVTTGRAR